MKTLQTAAVQPVNSINRPSAESARGRRWLLVAAVILEAAWMTLLATLAILR